MNYLKLKVNDDFETKAATIAKIESLDKRQVE
jgi:hypothetical protein